MGRTTDHDSTNRDRCGSQDKLYVGSVIDFMFSFYLFSVHLYCLGKIEKRGGICLEDEVFMSSGHSDSTAL